MKRYDFNADWLFQRYNFVKMGGRRTAAESTGIPVTLPHDAMILEERSESSPNGNSGGFYPGGDYSYTKTFYVPEEDKRKTYVLEFEGIYHQGLIYVNGDFAGSITYGYIRTLLDITPYLKYGSENIIDVKAINSDVPNSRWYSGSGLYRPVNLYIGDEIRIPVDGLKITTPDVSVGVSSIHTAIKLEYDGKTTRSLRINTEIYDAKGNLAAAESTPITLFDGEDHTVKQRIYIRESMLWSVDTPHLYLCKVTVTEDGKVLDETESHFGIRKFQMDPVNGLRLNGESILLRGSCIHHDNGVVGAATFARAEERRVEILKEAGFNAIRIAHNSASKAMLDACDRLGILVMDESFDMWNVAKNIYDNTLNFTSNYEAVLEDMVEKDYNHPSVFMYCIGNEIKEVGTPQGAKWTRRMTNFVRAKDATRFVTNAINGLMSIKGDLPMVIEDMGLISKNASTEGAAYKDINEVMTNLCGLMNILTAHPSVGEKLEEPYSELDAVGLNYMREAYEVYEKTCPNRISFGSETLPPDIDLNWSKVKSLPSCIGDFTWTGWDYIGEAGVGVVDYNYANGFFTPYPCYLAYVGDIDITGFRRPMSYYREIVWGLRKSPYIAVQYPQHYHDRAICTPWSSEDCVSSWTWPGFEGKPCKVEVYSDAEEVELLLNGQSLGKLPVGETNRFKAVFDIAYQPGKLETVAYTNGIETARSELTTAQENVHLDVDVDRSQLTANGQDLSYLMISLVDEQGVLNTSADQKIHVTVEGAGTLQGFGSADPMSLENFYDQERTTFNGVVLAVVRAGHEPGTIRVTVSSENGETSVTEIAVE